MEAIKMNMQKGVFFTLMVFLLLMPLLALHTATKLQGSSLSTAIAEADAFRAVSDKYSNIRRNASVLGTNTAESGIDMRILPFTYSVDANSFSLSTKLPVRQADVDSYLGIINGFRVFLEDTNYVNEFDSLRTDINTLTPAEWGGTDTDVSFVLRPQCVKYSILDSNTISFDSGNYCADYNYSSMRKQGITISLSSTHDFNALSCSFNGTSTCFADSFNPANPLPYINVALLDANCSKCALPQKTISGHFDPAQASAMTLSCSGTGCVTPALQMDFTGKTTLAFSGQRLDITYVTGFPNDIDEFAFSDINFSVENTYFNAKRWG